MARVLLLDNDSAFCRELAAALAKVNVEVVATLSSPDGLFSALWAHEPQVFIFDLSLVDEELLRTLLNLRGKGASRLRFLGLGRADMDEAACRAMSAGVDYCVLRPFDLATLVRRVQQLLASPPPTEAWLVPSSAAAGPLENQVKEVLTSLGVPSELKGYRFLVEAIVAVLRNPELINAVTRRLYPWVAVRCGSTPRRVERAIRTCIEATWSRGKLEALEQLFAFQIDPNRGKPTNASFIARIATEVRMRHNHRRSQSA